MRRVCGCGARWAAKNPYTEPLARWFRSLSHRFDMAMIEESVHTR